MGTREPTHLRLVRSHFGSRHTPSLSGQRVPWSQEPRTRSNQPTAAGSPLPPPRHVQGARQPAFPRWPLGDGASPPRVSLPRLPGARRRLPSWQAPSDAKARVSLRRLPGARSRPPSRQAARSRSRRKGWGALHRGLGGTRGACRRTCSRPHEEEPRK